MVMAAHKHPPSFSFPPAFVFTILPRNQSFGLSLLLSYSWLSLAMDLALDLAHMILEVQKHLKHTQFLFPTALAETFLSRNQSLGLSLLSSYSWLSLALDLALDLTQMILEVRKNLKPTQFFISNSFW